jgi:hypothetical protein
LLVAVLLIIAVFSVYAFFNMCSLVSECENRTLGKFPPVSAEAWFSGDFSLSLDGYLSDHVLLREELIPVTRFLEQLMRVQSRIRIIDMTKPN